MTLPPIPPKLARIRPLLEEFSAPCIAYALLDSKPTAAGQSRLGGVPDLPHGFVWPENNGRPLDFLLQVNLEDIAPFDAAQVLPRSGLLSFFYDLENQPWGYDPNDLGGYRVVYTPAKELVAPQAVPNPEFTLPDRAIAFREGLSFPAFGSLAHEAFNERAGLDDSENDIYAVFVADVARIGDPKPEGGRHRMLGHSENVQGDMQLEAQLVMNGLYCGNSTGYEDPRRRELEAGAHEWLLLLQLDSDDTAEFMWGDSGMLYYWIRASDLAALKFDNVWMTMQCC
jgi:uncharacterized protein YwqG